jgi:hypothetical protein
MTTDGAKPEISRKKNDTEKGAKYHGHKSDPNREEDETQRGEKSRSQRGAKRTLLYHDGIGEAGPSVTTRNHRKFIHRSIIIYPNSSVIQSQKNVHIRDFAATSGIVTGRNA